MPLASVFTTASLSRHTTGAILNPGEDIVVESASESRELRVEVVVQESDLICRGVLLDTVPMIEQPPQPNVDPVDGDRYSFALVDVAPGEHELTVGFARNHPASLPPVTDE